MSCAKCIIPCNYRVTNIRPARNLVNCYSFLSIHGLKRTGLFSILLWFTVVKYYVEYNSLYVHIYGTKGFIYRLSHDSHFDIDCATLTTYCRFSSGDIVDLLSRTICTTVQCRRLLHKYLIFFFQDIASCHTLAGWPVTKLLLEHFMAG